jgi:hypothetical protein
VLMDRATEREAAVSSGSARGRARLRVAAGVFTAAPRAPARDEQQKRPRLDGVHAAHRRDIGGREVTTGGSSNTVALAIAGQGDIAGDSRADARLVPEWFRNQTRRGRNLRPFRNLLRTQNTVDLQV